MIGVVHVILAFLKSSPAAQTALKLDLDTGTDAPPVAHVYSRTRGQKQVQHNTYKQTKANTKKQYNTT